MSVEPTGLFAGAMDGVRRLLINSPSWQALCGVDSASEAKSYVRFCEGPGRGATFPLAVIDYGDSHGLGLIGQGVGNVYRDRGSVLLFIWADFFVPCEITWAAGVATVELEGHGYEVGDDVEFEGWDQGEYNGVKPVASVIDADSFTVAVTGSPVSPGTGRGRVAPVSTEDNFGDCLVRFMNAMGPVVKDMAALSNTEPAGGLEPSFMSIKTFERVAGPARSEESEENAEERPWHVIGYRLEWGK